MKTFGEYCKILKQNCQQCWQKIKANIRKNKLNQQITTLEEEIKQEYQTLGIAFYNQNKNHQVNEQNPLNDICDKITTAQAQIAEKQEMICYLDGKVRCVHCGKILKAGCIYCSECGSALPQFQLTQKEEPQRVCEQCGCVVEEDAVFCTKCGHRLGEDSKDDTSHVLEDTKKETEETEQKKEENKDEK